MKIHEATEQAYKNGYEDGKRDAVKHGQWIVKGQDVFCSHCDEESGYNPWGASSFSRYCPNCGARMDGEEKNSNLLFADMEEIIDA